jgi:hypothetical protein
MKTIRPNRQGYFTSLPSPTVCDVALGNGSHFCVYLIRQEDRLHLGLEGAGAYRFDMSQHFTYVMEKLRLGEGDARNMADFIADQLQVQTERQGSYEPRLCHC